MPNAMRPLNIVTRGTAPANDALSACQPGAAPGRTCLWLLGELQFQATFVLVQ
jgi:hypothetical protein